MNKWDYLGMDPLSEWMEENGLFVQPVDVAPPPGGYGEMPKEYYDSTYAIAPSPGMFADGGFYDPVAKTFSIAAAAQNAMEGVSYMGQAEQALGDHKNYLYNGGSAFGFGTIHGGMTDQHGWFPGMRVTDDGNIVKTSVVVKPFEIIPDDAPKPIALPSDDGMLPRSNVPEPTMPRSEYVDPQRALGNAVVGAFGQYSAALYTGAAVGEFVGNVSVPGGSYFETGAAVGTLARIGVARLARSTTVRAILIHGADALDAAIPGGMRAQNAFAEQMVREASMAQAVPAVVRTVESRPPPIWLPPGNP